MDFINLLRSRYSVRAYKSDLVEEDMLRKVLEAARIAPSAANRQPLEIIVIHTKGREEELKRIYKTDWFTSAPIIICICAKPSEAWVRSDGKNYSDVDAAIAMDYLILSATNQGLGTCWIAAFDAIAAREVLGIPDGVEPVLFTPLGYPADEPRQTNRKHLHDILHNERY